MWYHTSGDTVDKADSTQLKRVYFLTSAAAIFLGSTGPREAQIMMAETASRGLVRAERMVSNAEPARLAEIAKEAMNVVTQASMREKDALASVAFFIRNDPPLEDLRKARIQALDSIMRIAAAAVERVYEQRAAAEGQKYQKPAHTPQRGCDKCARVQWRRAE